MSRRRRGPGLAPMIVLLACALVLGAAVAIEVGSDPTAVEPLAAVEAVPPSSGWWYCPVTAGEDEEAVLTIVPATADATTVTVVRHTAEGRVAERAVEVPAGGRHVRTLEAGESGDPVAVQWAGGPAVATWTVHGADETAAAPCEAAPAPRWHVTGFDTTAQNRGLLHLFNPFGVDAVVRVTFGTPSGLVALVLTDNVLVPAGDTLVLELGDFEPEQPDLAVTVTSLAGRVVVGGETRLRPTANQPGPTGRALLRASPEPAGEWNLAVAASREGASSWVSVYNPGEREAAVQVRVSDPLPDGAALLSEASVPAGGVLRLELDDTSATPTYGVSVQTVTDLPVVVTGLSVVRTGAGDAVAASLAAAAAPQWALAGAETAGHLARVALYNPGAEPVTVALDAGDATPEAWSAIDLPANGHVIVDLSEAAGDSPSLPLRATGDGPFVVELRARGTGEPVRLWSTTAVPARVWEGSPTRPPSWRDPVLSTSPVEPIATDEPDPGR